jgi:hypothetical protein
LGLIMMAFARHLSRWKAPKPEPVRSAVPAALEVAGQEADGHPGWRFGNLR